MRNIVMQKGSHIRALLTLSSLLGFAGLAAAEDNLPRLSKTELADVVAPIALYPDDLVAIVLPAASYPLQLVQAQRTLDDGGNPDADWDEAVVAIMNYPEVVELLNEDLDWTYGLGLAFINQEADVFNAIQDFRADALAAGNLKSDTYQSVRVDNDGNILIEPRAKDTLYVPYYEPQRVIVRHVVPVYHYYPIARPVYYYPYPARYSFNVSHFYGVGTYFSIGWQYRGLNLFYASGPSHPYAGYYYPARYTPRHYYYAPRVRHQVVVNQRHHYQPRYNKPVKHRANYARSNADHRPVRHQARPVRTQKDFRPAKYTPNRTADVRPNQRKELHKELHNELQKPQHRLARGSLKDQQARKQAKFRDPRKQAENFGRKTAMAPPVRQDSKTKAQQPQSRKRVAINNGKSNNAKSAESRPARRDARPQRANNTRQQVRQQPRQRVSARARDSAQSFGNRSRAGVR